MGSRFGLILSDGAGLSPSQAVKDGVLGEKSGFDSVWIPDHLTDYEGGARVDCWTVLAGIGVQTQKVLLSPGVTDVHIIHPAKAAQIIASLDELTGGRAMVALGAGEAMSIVPFGIEFENAKGRAQRVKEYIDVLKLLWTATREKRASYQGDFYNLKEAFIIQQPTRKPHPPIYLGAIESKTLLKMTGEITDGWFPWMTTAEIFRDGVSAIKEAASGAGRKMDQIDTVAWIYTCVSKDKNVLRAATNAAKVGLYVSQYILRRFGYKETGMPHYTHMLAHEPFLTWDSMVEAAKDVPDDVVHKSCMIKESPNECIEFIDEYIKAGAKHIGIRPMACPVKDLVEQVSKVVIPHFKDQE
jgi:alkanesulfonate monooxygenase SsuD/methylene tetrahydromethanopterin reductase-like flavin-dependent oxidoreductase (luciferase family)